MVNSYFFNSYIATDDIFNPNKANIKKESLVVSNQHACDKLFITYKYSTVSMDYGFIFESPVKTDNIKISNYVPDQVPHTRDLLGYNIIYDVEVDADHFRSTTYVRFMKIQEALATMGGIISILKLVIGLILEAVNKFSFSFLLFSEVYLNGEKYINLDRPFSESELKEFENLKVSAYKNNNKINKNLILRQNEKNKDKYKHLPESSKSIIENDKNENKNYLNKINEEISFKPTKIKNLDLLNKSENIKIPNTTEKKNFLLRSETKIEYKNNVQFSENKLINFLEKQKNPNQEIIEQIQDPILSNNDIIQFKSFKENKDILKSSNRNFLPDKNNCNNNFIINQDDDYSNKIEKNNNKQINIIKNIKNNTKNPSFLKSLNKKFSFKFWNKYF